MFGQPADTNSADAIIQPIGRASGKLSYNRLIGQVPEKPGYGKALTDGMFTE
jgi:hypothetical protein